MAKAISHGCFIPGLKAGVSSLLKKYLAPNLTPCLKPGMRMQQMFLALSLIVGKQLYRLPFFMMVKNKVHRQKKQQQPHANQSCY